MAYTSQIHDSGLSCTVDWREIGQKISHSVGLNGIFELVVAASSSASVTTPPAQNQNIEYVDYLGRNFNDLAGQISDPPRDFAPSTPQQTSFATPRSENQERATSSSTKRSILKQSRLDLSSLDNSGGLVGSGHKSKTPDVEDPARIFATLQETPVPCTKYDAFPVFLPRGRSRIALYAS